MAQNNETQVVNGVVQPRLYQVYGDLIESKEVMEPIAIANGTGPVCGFDWVDTTKNTLTIGSIFSSDREDMKRGARRVFLSNKDNTAGQVFNAFITPDGLLSIAPDILTLTGQNPPGGWPDMSNPSKMVTFALIATHRYSANKDEPVPSPSNFKVAWLTNAHVEPEYYIDKIVDMNYPQILDWVTKKSSVSINSNTDTLLGVYMIGWIPSWNTFLPGWKELMQSIGYQLCINPYQGILPAKPLGMNPFSLMRLDNRVKVLEQSTVPGEVSSLTSHVNNLISSLGQGIEVIVSKDSASSDDNEGFIFSKLNINGSNFVAARPVTKTLNYQWYESSDAMGIFVSPEIDIDSKTQQVPTDKWDIGTVVFEPNSEGAMEYSLVSPPYGKETWKLVGCILPQFSAYSKGSICVPTGFYQLMNPDAAMGWRVAMNLKRLHSRLSIVEVADSGKLSFTPTSSSDHYAYVKALMGTSTLTLRVVVCLYNKGTSNAGLTYDLSKLFSKNSRMSLMLSEILRLRNSSESMTRVMMAMPSTFKARDIEPELSSSEDCEFSKYTSWLEITNYVARVKASVGTVTKASGPETWVEVAHMITIPISDRTGEEYAGIQA
jgi:hypothetical protein